MKNRALLSILSIIFIALVGMRYNVSILAWIVFVPLLLLIRITNGFKNWFLVFIILQIGYFLQIVKIITNPMPLVMALMFSIPMALGSFVFLWVFEKIRRRVGDILGVFFFASLMSVGEWLTYYTSELGSWGAMSYTQLDNLAFLQLSSLFGITFGSFFIYLSSAFIVVFIASNEKKRFLKPALISCSIYVMFYTYGVIRLENIQPSKTIKVAAVISDMQITHQSILDKKHLQNNTKFLIKKTIKAIKQDAKLIAWNEAATIIFKEQEESFIKELKEISKRYHVDLIIAYIVPIDGIKKFENKYIYLQNGELKDEYFKNYPVPGEGAIKGEKIAKVIQLDKVKISGAICYDFDFPTLGRELAKNNTDIAIIPSSDWKGIDPIHAKMATVRAIEGGYALLRPVREATTIATDAYGNIRASMSYFEKNDRIMIALLPTKRVSTLYSKVGDIFPMILLLFVGFVVIRYIKSR